MTDGTGTLKVDVLATGAVSHRAKTLSQPRKMIVVDVYPAVMGKSVKTSIDVNRGLVEKVRVVQYSDTTVRMYVDCISLPVYKVVTEGRGLTVAISSAMMAEAKEPQAPSETAETQPQPQPRPQPRPVAQNTPRPQPQPRPVNVRRVTEPTSPPVSALRPRTPARRAYTPRPKLVSLDFVNADLVYVVKVLCKEMDKNVYVGPGVQGSVTVTLKNVPAEGALALILKMQDTPFDYKVLDDQRTIVVAEPEKLTEIANNILGASRTRQAPKDAVRQEFILEAAPAAKVVEFLQGQYPEVKFTPHPTMNGFYAAGSKKDILSIKSELPNLDRVPPPPEPPAREFLSVKYGDVQQVQNLLKTLVPDLQYNVDERLKLLVVEGTPSAIDQAKGLLAELDRPLDQVMIDVKVVDLTESGAKRLGVQWANADGAQGTFDTVFTEGAFPDVLLSNPQANSPFAPGGLSLFTVGLPDAAGNSIVTPASNGIQITGAGNTNGGTAIKMGLPIGPFVRAPFIINSTVQFLVSNNEAKILASPRVATQSGTEALIHIGDKFPIVYFDPRAGQFQVQYVDIGIKLDVKPEIKADGFIVTELRPEVSNLIELVNNQYPRTAIRTVNTTMRIKDGDTVVIGGLIREDERVVSSRIPLLGDLPILGVLFRNTQVDKNRSEVVMMLTPHIMR
ncbi:MAG: secretin N-terminal domain-containing protein [Candidatus Eremiobacterota bacterium]